MKLRVYPAFFLSAAVLSLACGGLVRAQDEVDVSKIVAEALKENNNPPPAPAPAPAPAKPDAGDSPAPTDGRSAADRAIAEAIRGDLAEIDSATQLWAKEKKKAAKTKVTLHDILPYMKPESPVLTSGGNDRAGNAIDFGTVDDGPHISSATAKSLGQPADFWGDYAPVISKRELATQSLADLKQLRLAVLSWDAANPGAAPGPVTFDVIKGYLPADAEVLQSEGYDRLGYEYMLGTPKDPVHISAETYKELGMPKEFWGEFAPKSSGTTRTASRRSSEPPPRSFGRKIKDFFKGR